MRSTMVFVTHDQMEAMTLATRIVVMNKGRIEQVGTPIEVYRRPATRFVAGFVGTPSMNFLPVASVESERGRATAVLADGMRVPTSIPTAQLPAGPLTLGVRAEHVMPGQGSPAAIEVLEHLGDRTLIHARMRDGTTLVYAEPGDSTLRAGDTVELQADGSAVHLFDDTGRAFHGR
jgi:multiple sugar transport system ATP-binding protein